MAVRNLKERLRAGEVTLGTHSYLASPAAIEIIGRTGFDWVMIDLEHAPVGPYDTLMLEGLIRAAEVSGTTPIVRVPENNAVMIMKVLESGAAGITVPHIHDGESARRAVSATRYPPHGIRGMCPNTRRAGYSQIADEEGTEFWENENARILTVALVEDYEAIENIEDIVAVDGIDVINIGVGDLSLAMGAPVKGLEFDNPRVLEAVAHCIKVVRSKGKAVGTQFFYPNIAAAEPLIRQGCQWLTCTADVRIFHQACTSIVKGVAKFTEPQPAR